MNAAKKFREFFVKFQDFFIQRAKHKRKPLRDESMPQPKEGGQRFSNCDTLNIRLVRFLTWNLSNRIRVYFLTVWELI